MTALIIGGLLPDIDFLFLFFKWFNQAHRVVTHNIFFILLASLIAVLFANKGSKQSVGIEFISGRMFTFNY